MSTGAPWRESHLLCFITMLSREGSGVLTDAHDVIKCFLLLSRLRPNTTKILVDFSTEATCIESLPEREVFTWSAGMTRFDRQHSPEQHDR